MRKLDGMENSRSKSDAHYMHGWRETRAQLEPRCGVKIMMTGTWLLDYAHMGWRVHHSRVEVHVRYLEGALGLGGHDVIGVVRLVARFHHAYAIPCVEFFPSGYCSLIVHLQSDCILWSSISSVAKLLHTFASQKTGHLRCCLYRINNKHTIFCVSGACTRE